MPTRNTKFLFFGISLVLILLFIGTCRKAGTWLVKNDNPKRADALVILMGSIPDRVLQASDLYNQHVSGKIIIVESGMGAYKALEARGVYIISNTKQVHDALVTLGIPADSIIILPGDATSTLMEARIIREYITNNPGLDSLLLISSSSHMRRASIIFNAAFSNTQEPPTILCSPSSYTNFNKEKWWMSRDGIEVVLWEYVKMVGFLVGSK